MLIYAYNCHNIRIYLVGVSPSLAVNAWLGVSNLGTGSVAALNLRS